MKDRAPGALRNVRPLILLVAATGTLAGVCTIAIMGALATVVSHVFLQHQGLPQVQKYLFWLVAAMVGRAMLIWLQEVLARETGVRFKQELRADIFAQLLRLGPTYTAGEAAGELSQLISTGIEQVEPYVATYLPHTMVCLTVPLVILAAIFTRDRVSAVIWWLPYPYFHC